MTAAPPSNPFDRHSEIGALTGKMTAAVKRMMRPLVLVLAAEAAYLGIEGRPGAGAFAMIGLGTCIALHFWSRGAIGLPLLPLMAAQSLVIYGVPIVAGHANILTYPADFVLRAGVEVLVFCVAMTAAWSMGMGMMHPSPPVSHALHEFNKEGIRGWARLGFGMVIAATAFQIFQGLGFLGALMSSLPIGADFILFALLSVLSASGSFLVSMIIGANEASAVERLLFWGLLIANAMISSADFILAAAAANLITVAIGLFWSSGRVPWKYLTIALVSLSFLNMGKTTMRVRYWENDYSPATQVTLQKLPAIYLEWLEASYDAILENNADRPRGSGAGAKTQSDRNQTLLDRIDNLQNLLFVIDAVETDHIKPLGGATYTLIPPLLVPRVLWPEKPRAHAGQVMLNVHFGRQDLESTFVTYIAWGLLPEAYGNFGPVVGAVCLGVFLGLLFAGIENLSARKLVMSTEGFLCLALLMNLMNSFEMVASVLVTSTFQSMMIIVLASIPFVRRTQARKPQPGDA